MRKCFYNRSCDKKSRKCMRALLAALSAVLLAAGLSGCAVTTLPADSQSVEESGDSAENGSGKEEIENAVFVSGSADTMVETEKNLYFKHGGTIWRLEKESGQLEKLRVFSEEESNQTFWVAGSMLYFDITKSTDLSGGSDIGLYGIDFTSGKEERLANLSVTPSNLYASDGYLYAQGYQTRESYRIQADKTLTRDDAETGTIYEKIPEGLQEFYNVSLAYAADHWGYMPLWDGETLVLADKDGSNPRKLPEKNFGQIFDENGVYGVIQEQDSHYVCKRYDAKTLEEKIIFETGTYPTLLQHRDGKLYYMENSHGLPVGDSLFYAVDDQGGEPKQMAVLAMEPGIMTGEFYSYYGNFYVTGDGFYCQKIKDYGTYLAKLDMEGNEISLTEPALYQSPVRKLGHVEADSKTIPCQDGEKDAAEYYVERLVFDGDSDAEKLMNQTGEAEAKVQIEAGAGLAALSDESWIHDEEYRENTLTYLVAGVTYLDDNYCCVRYDGYEYSGGAHGMPYRNYFLFDRKTGKQLALEDILETSETELKTLVSSHFRKLSEETGFSFQSPEDLEKTVAENISLGSPFYATEEGLVFFYTPYELAAYAYGFPTVVVPYEELKLKIDLK